MKANRNILILVVFLLIIGCIKKEDSQLIKGNIVGFVSLVDESGQELTDKSGVNVAINNTSYSSLTSENGRFELKGMPAGTYTIVYSKDNFGTFKRCRFQFVGGNVPAVVYTYSLYQLPDIELQNLDISYNNNYIDIYATLEENIQYSLHVFLKDSANVSSTNYDYHATYSEDLYLSFIYHSIHLSHTPFQEGETVYCKLYFANVFDNTTYYNEELDLSIKPSLAEASDVVEVHLED